MSESTKEEMGAMEVEEDLEDGEIEDDEEEVVIAPPAPPPPTASAGNQGENSLSKGEGKRNKKGGGKKGLKRALDADEEKKRILKEKLKVLERQMAGEDYDPAYDDEEEEDQTPEEEEEEEEYTGDDSADDEEMGVYTAGGSPKRYKLDETLHHPPPQPMGPPQRRNPIHNNNNNNRLNRNNHKPRRKELRLGNRPRNNKKNMKKSDEICKMFMQGKCPKSPENCLYSHDAIPPKMMELCKFYLFERCAKREKCLYLHKGFPCKYYHTGNRCLDTGDTCKFSHEPLTDDTRGILLKHLEAAPKEILGEFPRLTREVAASLVFATEAKNKGWLDDPTQKKDDPDKSCEGSEPEKESSKEESSSSDKSEDLNKEENDEESRDLNAEEQICGDGTTNQRKRKSRWQSESETGGSTVESKQDHFSAVSLAANLLPGVYPPGYGGPNFSEKFNEVEVQNFLRDHRDGHFNADKQPNQGPPNSQGKRPSFQGPQQQPKGQFPGRNNNFNNGPPNNYNNGPPNNFNSGPNSHNYNGPPGNFNNGPNQNYNGPPNNYSGPPNNYSGPPNNYNNMGGGPNNFNNGPPNNFNGPPHNNNYNNGPPNNFNGPHNNYNGPPNNFNGSNYNGPNFNGPPHPNNFNNGPPNNYNGPRFQGDYRGGNRGGRYNNRGGSHRGSRHKGPPPPPLMGFTPRGPFNFNGNGPPPQGWNNNNGQWGPPPYQQGGYNNQYSGEEEEEEYDESQQNYMGTSEDIDEETVPPSDENPLEASTPESSESAEKESKPQQCSNRDPRASRDPRKRNTSPPKPPAIDEAEKERRILDLDISAFGDLELPSLNEEDEDSNQGLPFKPHCIQGIAKEIDASFSSHSPMEYTLHALVLEKPNYTDIISKHHIPASVISQDPRLRRYSDKAPSTKFSHKQSTEPPPQDVYNPKRDLIQHKYAQPVATESGAYSPSQDVQDMYGKKGNFYGSTQEDVYNPRQDLSTDYPYKQQSQGYQSSGSNRNDPRMCRRDPRRRE